MTFTVTVVDTTPPSIASVAPSQSSLWPPNKKMATVSLSVNASDNVTSSPGCAISSVSSNEAGAGQWEIAGPLELMLQSDRLGSGTGRVYTIAITCVDSAGNVSEPATTTVTVPHDQGR